MFENWTRRSAVCLLLLGLAGCGGGTGAIDTPPGSTTPAITSFAAERTALHVGERARLTGVFTGERGTLEPGGQTVRSGVPVDTAPLSRDTRFRLVVTGAGRTVTAELPIAVTYRDTLRTIDTVPARGGHVAVSLADGRVLLVGGEDGGNVLPDTALIVDPSAGTATRTARFASGRVAHFAVPLVDGSVLVGGGVRNLTGAPSAERYDPAADAVRTTGALVRSRVYAAATRLADGRVLVLGGMNGGGLDRTGEIYEPANGTFVAAPGALDTARAGHTVTPLPDGRVLVYGGITPDGTSAPEVYDPGSGQTHPVPAPESGVRANHAAVLAGGHVWILGGEDLSGAPRGDVLRFDPAARSFTRVSSLAVPRSLPGAAALADGRVFVAGGAATSDLEATDAIELLASDGTRRDGPPLARARLFHSATALPDGRVLVYGGVDRAGSLLTSMEIYE